MWGRATKLPPLKRMPGFLTHGDSFPACRQNGSSQITILTPLRDAIRDEFKSSHGSEAGDAITLYWGNIDPRSYDISKDFRRAATYRYAVSV